MSAASTGRLDFVLRLIDRVSTPLSRVQTSFSDLATRGQAGITQMGVGMAGVVGTAVALQQAMAPALAQQAALGELKSLGVAADGLELLNQKSLEFSIAYGENAIHQPRAAHHLGDTDRYPTECESFRAADVLGRPDHKYFSGYR